MRGARYDLTIKQGTTLSFAFRLLSKPSIPIVSGEGVIGVDSGVEIDPRLLEFRSQFRATVESEVVLLELSSQNFSIQSRGNETWVYVKASPLQTKFLEVGGVYDMQMITPSGDTTEILYGNFSLIKSVTR